MRIIIEGAKLSGKSTLVNLFREQFRTSTLLQYRAYFEVGGHRYQVSKNIYDRMRDLSTFIKSIYDDDLIMLRGHLFLFAIAEATEQELNCEFETIENLFKDLDLIIVFLTINQTAFEQRLALRLESGREVREWDKEWENVSAIQDSYLSFLEKSLMKKFIFDSTKFSPDYILKQIVGDI